MAKRAFALREDAKETFSDAAVSLGARGVLRVGARLKEGGGVIVTDNVREQRALDRVTALKEVPVKQAEAKGRRKQADQTTKAGESGGKDK